MNAEQLELFPKEEPENASQRFEEAEWCFQFFEDEPVVFAWSDTPNEDGIGDLVLSVAPTESSNITFSHKGMTLKVFARPMSEETRLMREESKKQ